MALKPTYESLDDVPEHFHELYTQRGDRYEFTGVEGIQTIENVRRLEEGIRKEREETRKAKEAARVWEGLDFEDVRSKLDRFPELEAAASGKLDDDKIDEIVNRRVEGTLRTKLSPLERQLKKAEEEKAALAEENQKFATADRRRRMQDKLRKALTEAKALPEAMDDAFLLGENLLEELEGGEFVIRDGAPGFTPGLDVTGLVAELQEKRRHWWPESVSGGARGSGPGGSGGGKNPWSADHWNLTEQGRLMREHGRERCEQLARAAGTTIGGSRPQKKG